MSREPQIRRLIQEGSDLQRTINDLAASLAAAERENDEEEARLLVAVLTDPDGPITGKNETIRKAQTTVWFAEDACAATWRERRLSCEVTRELLAQTRAALTEAERLVRLEMELLRNDTARLGDPFAWAATMEEPAPAVASNGYDRESATAAVLAEHEEGVPF